MSKLLLTGLSIAWRVDYDENGKAVGRHVAIFANAEEAAPNGKRFGANMRMSRVMLDQIKINEQLFKEWVEAESNHIVKGFSIRAYQAGIEVNIPDMLIPLREQLTEGMKSFCENDMPWYHTFYIIKTLKPGESVIDDTHIDLKDPSDTCDGFINTSNEPKVFIFKAD
jgi:hypothetical protein